MANSSSNSRPENKEIDLRDAVILVTKHWKLLVYGPLLAAILTALLAKFAITPTFTATTRILPPQQQQSSAALLAAQLGALASIAGANGVNIRNPADMYAALLKSRTIADRLIDRFGLTQLYGKTYRQEVRDTLANATEIKTSKEGLITIEVDDHNPQRAADLANAYVKELQHLNDSLAITEAQQRRLFFEKQLRQSQADLKKAEAALAEVGANENVLKSAPQAMIEGIARLKAMITAQEVRISTMRSYLAESSPELQLAQQELASLRFQLLKTERDQPLNRSQNHDYLNRYREFKYYETLFELMAKQYELAKLDESREGAFVQVVDPAIPPEKKSRPKVLLTTVGALLGTAVLLLLFILGRAAFRNSFPHSNVVGSR